MLFKEKQTIFPLGLGYCFCLLLGTLLTLIAGIACFIWTLCGQNQTGSLIIFGNDTILNRFLEGFLILIIGILCFYFTIFRLYYNDRLIFSGKKIKKNKRKVGFSCSCPAFEINCSEIISAKIDNKFYAYLLLLTKEDNVYKIFITPFSRKQILKICLIINQRGGQIDIEEIQNFLNNEYLFGKRRK